MASRSIAEVLSDDEFSILSDEEFEGGINVSNFTLQSEKDSQRFEVGIEKDIEDDNIFIGENDHMQLSPVAEDDTQKRLLPNFKVRNDSDIGIDYNVDKNIHPQIQNHDKDSYISINDGSYSVSNYNEYDDEAILEESSNDDNLPTTTADNNLHPNTNNTSIYERSRKSYPPRLRLIARSSSSSSLNAVSSPIGNSWPKRRSYGPRVQREQSSELNNHYNYYHDLKNREVEEVESESIENDDDNHAQLTSKRSSINPYILTNFGSTTITNDGNNNSNNRISKKTRSSSFSSTSISSSNTQNTNSMLSEKRIFGTSAQSETCFMCVGNIITYAAGAGVVVASVISGQIVGQRYFCANNYQTTATHGFGSNYEKVTSPTCTTTIFTNNSSLGDDGSYMNINREEHVIVYKKNIRSTPNLEDSNSKKGSLHDKVRTISCLAFSQDATLLAVGEAGYRPRILIYSAKKSTDTPIAIIYEHQFGVKALAFSPKGNFLSSLGFSNDGYLYIWSLEYINKSSQKAKILLHSSNKCTAEVNKMLWINENKIITLGLRHLKIWRFENDNYNQSNYYDDNDRKSQPINSALAKPKIITGKSVITGNAYISNPNFTDCIQIFENLLLLLTENGELCTLIDFNDDYDIDRFNNNIDNNNKIKSKILVLDWRGGISMCFKSGLFDTKSMKVWLIGNEINEIVSFDITDILNLPIINNEKDFKRSIQTININNKTKKKLYDKQQKNGCISISLLSDGGIACLSNSGDIVYFSAYQKKHEQFLQLNTSKCLVSGYNCGIKGIKNLNNTCSKTIPYNINSNQSENGNDIDNGKSFLTWSEDGLIRIRNFNDGFYELSNKTIDVKLMKNLDLEFPLDNVLTAVAVGFNNEIIVGDRYGILKIFLPNINNKTDSGENSDSDDNYGTFDNKEKVLYEVKAHSSEINDIQIRRYEELGLDMIFSISRDRTIQIFYKWYKNSSSYSPSPNINHDSDNIEDEEEGSPNDWNVLQTLIVHKGNVQKLLISDDNKWIITGSLDRTVAIHKFNYLPESGKLFFTLYKSLSLKSSPIEMCLHRLSSHSQSSVQTPTGSRSFLSPFLSPLKLHHSTSKLNLKKNDNIDNSDSCREELIIVTNDKQVNIYKFPNGQFHRSLRLADTNGETLGFSFLSLVPFPNDITFMIGIGTDKSIRAYDYNTGQLLSSRWGHSGSISSFIAFENNNNDYIFISSGLDGCVFIWDFSPNRSKLLRKSQSTRNIHDLLSIDSPSIGSFSEINNEANQSLLKPIRKVWAKNDLLIAKDNEERSHSSRSTYRSPYLMTPTSRSSSQVRKQKSMEMSSNNTHKHPIHSLSKARSFMNISTQKNNDDNDNNLNDVRVNELSVVDRLSRRSISRMSSRSSLREVPTPPPSLQRKPSMSIVTNTNRTLQKRDSFSSLRNTNTELRRRASTTFVTDKSRSENTNNSDNKTAQSTIGKRPPIQRNTSRRRVSSSSSNTNISTPQHIKNIDDHIEGLIDQLVSFRSYYSCHVYSDQARLERLKNQLHQTLSQLNVPIVERSRMDELLEHFADKLCNVIENRDKEPVTNELQDQILHKIDEDKKIITYDNEDNDKCENEG